MTAPESVTPSVLLAGAAYDAACDAWQSARAAERTAQRAVDFARAVWEHAAEASTEAVGHRCGATS